MDNTPNVFRYKYRGNIRYAVGTVELYGYRDADGYMCATLPRLPYYETESNARRVARKAFGYSKLYKALYI